VKGIRLRCRAHNQYEAEQVFGAGFMDQKRTRSCAQSDPSDNDVMKCLRTLGFRVDEALRATAFSATKRDAPLEERVRLALSWLRPRSLSRSRAPGVRGHEPVNSPRGELVRGA
jgi:hypothetical protein